MQKTRLRFWLVAVSPVVLVIALFTMTLRVGEPVRFPRREIPHERQDPQRCNWSCHNHGCRHAPRLPDWLSGDRGLFGQTIRLLRRAGTVMVPTNPGVGYGLANLLLFCIAWPGLMWGLFCVAIAQWLRRGERRRRREATR